MTKLLTDRFTPRQIAHKHWNCADCGRNVIKIGEYTLVQPKVWKRAGMEWKGNLCIACLEKRIGRKLRPWRDFISFPVNPGGFDNSDLYTRRIIGETAFAVSKLKHPDPLPKGWKWRKQRGHYYATDGHAWIGDL
jgi:hypothetical protein